MLATFEPGHECLGLVHGIAVAYPLTIVATLILEYQVDHTAEPGIMGNDIIGLHRGLLGLGLKFVFLCAVHAFIIAI